MATYVIYSDAADATVYSSDATYATARSGGSYGTISGFTNDLRIGQVLSGGVYYCYQGFVSFDTSSVVGTVESATLALYGDTDNSGIDFTVYARAKDWGTSVTSADWTAGASLSGLSLRASLSTSGMTTAGYNTFTSDGSFASNTANPVRLVLSSSRLEAGNTPANADGVPTNDERFYFKSSEASGTTEDPKLTIVAYVTRTFSADAIVQDVEQSRTFSADAIVATRPTRDVTADGLVEQGERTLTRTVVGESATGNVRVFGATQNQAYRVYNSGGTVLESAVADANGKVQFTSAVNGGVYIVGFTDNTYATRLDGQWWRGTVATGNVFSADPSLIPDAGIRVLATDGSYYYATSQFGSRGQIVQTADYQFIVYRTGGAGSSYGASDGNVVAIRVDRSTGLVDQGPVTIRSGIGEGHELFCIAQAPNGKLRFVYGGQNDHLYMRESSSANDVSAWGSATQISSVAPAAFAGGYVIDSDGNNHICGGTYSGGYLVYGTSLNATPTSFTWTTVVNTYGTTSTGNGVLFGDYVLYESGGVKKHMVCFGTYAKSGGFGTTTAYKNAYYLSSSDGFATIKKADGTSAGTVPLAYSGTTQSLTGADEVSSLYHAGSWLKIAQVSGTPYILLDNDRNNLPVGNAPGEQSVSYWSGSAWTNNEIADLPMWLTSPHTDDTQDSRDVVNANWGVNIQSRGSIVYVYACVGYPTLSSLDTGHTGMRLLRFRSSDGFATYQTDQMVDEGYGGFTYTDLYDGGAKRGIGIWAAGFGYPKVPDDPATVLFSIVDKDYATLATSSLTLTEFTADAVIRATRTFTADGVVLDRPTRTFTADATIVNPVATQTTRTFTADASVTVTATTTTTTFTSDAIVETAAPETQPPDPSLVSERRKRARRYFGRGGEW